MTRLKRDQLGWKRLLGEVECARIRSSSGQRAKPPGQIKRRSQITGRSEVAGRGNSATFRNSVEIRTAALVSCVNKPANGYPVKDFCHFCNTGPCNCHLDQYIIATPKLLRAELS